MNIIIAEDNEVLRNVLTDFIKKKGHSVNSAGNALELAKAALAKRPDLIITDLYMPKISADSTLAMLDLYPGFSGIPVIIITGAASWELAELGIPKEIPVLFKPFDFARLSAEVNKIVLKLQRNTKRTVSAADQRYPTCAGNPGTC